MEKPENEEHDHEWEFVDDSFSHEFGTELIHYYRCECGETKKAEPGDSGPDEYDYDYDYDYD